MDRSGVRESVLRQSYVFNTGEQLLTQEAATSTVHSSTLPWSVIRWPTGTTSDGRSEITQFAYPKPTQLQEDQSRREPAVYRGLPDHLNLATLPGD